MIAWVLNLEADNELRSPLGYNASPKVLARVTQMRTKIVDLVQPDDVVVGDAPATAEHVGLCWCPTPSALRKLDRAGVAPAATPAFEVVREVNHRSFSLALGTTLSGACWVENESALRAAIAAGCESGQWVMKRPFSAAGSGRRVLRTGRLQAADEPWVQASFREDGLVLEPWVPIEGELVVHGYVLRDGGAVFGEVCVQLVDDYGAWQRTVRDAATISESERAPLLEEAGQVAEALGRAGYFGPFGIDAFRYRHAGGVALNVRSEINARYTMGWAVGMGSTRPDRMALPNRGGT